LILNEDSKNYLISSSTLRATNYMW